jgi:hypothetical protein
MKIESDPIFPVGAAYARRTGIRRFAAASRLATV